MAENGMETLKALEGISLSGIATSGAAVACDACLKQIGGATMAETIAAVGVAIGKQLGNNHQK